MNIEELRNYCLSLAYTSEKLPFDENTLVFYVMGKMFCLTNIEDYSFVNLKCDPEYAIELRERYEEISPGYHMNKKHWNSVSTIGGISDSMMKSLIDDSYNLVLKGVPKKVKDSFINENIDFSEK